ncbi:hypothetical protein K0M31_018621, partial [Melipona bicolor]
IGPIIKYNNRKIVIPKILPKARYILDVSSYNKHRTQFSVPVWQKLCQNPPREKRMEKRLRLSETLQSRSVSPSLLSHDAISVFQPEFLLHRSGTISADNGSGDESCADLFPGHYGTPTSQETHRRSRNCSVQSFAVPAERMDVLESQDVPSCNDTLIVVLTPGLAIPIAVITKIVRIVPKSEVEGQIPVCLSDFGL